MNYKKIFPLGVFLCCFLQIRSAASSPASSSAAISADSRTSRSPQAQVYKKEDILNLIRRARSLDVGAIENLDQIYLSGRYSNLPKLFRPNSSSPASNLHVQNLKAKAAEGDADAMLELGHIYVGEKHNIQKAMLWYMQAAYKEKKEKAFLSLARLFKNTGRDEALEKILREGAELGFQWALNQYAMNKLAGDTELPSIAIDKMPRGHLKERIKLAKAGLVQSMLDLGSIYQYEKQNIPAAIRWYRKAAEKGNEIAIISLLNIYKEQGRGELFNSKFAKLLDKAVKLGYVWALGPLAVYNLELGLDFMAIDTLQKLANMGNEEAIFLLISIRNNKEHSFPLARAVDWYHKVGWRNR